jgi:hypothetical protein
VIDTVDGVKFRRARAGDEFVKAMARRAAAE